jgi:hypothetical protein
MTTSLAMRREYLAAHRRMILGRALAGTVASAIPVPLLDEWAVGAVVGGGYRRIAASHGVDLEADAVRQLVFGKAAPPGWFETTASAVAFRVAARAWKRAMVLLTAVRRAQAASRTFSALTLFDHYCARRHRGLGLAPARALELRGVIGEVIAETPGGLSLEPFRQGLVAAARASLRAPLELADIASGGALRRLVERADPQEVIEAEVVDEVEAALDRQLADRDGVLARAIAALDQQLSAEVNPYVDALIERFDARWVDEEGGR